MTENFEILWECHQQRWKWYITLPRWTANYTPLYRLNALLPICLHAQGPTGTEKISPLCRITAVDHTIPLYTISTEYNTAGITVLVVKVGICNLITVPLFRLWNDLLTQEEQWSMNMWISETKVYTVSLLPMFRTCFVYYHHHLVIVMESFCSFPY